MNKRPAGVAALVALILVAATDAGLSQAAQTPTPPAAPAQRPADAAPIPYVLTMGDMMNTLVQPRHAKLGLAGRAENWPLAAYALVEIRQSFARIVKAQPRFRGMPVPELVDAALTQAEAAVEAAIKQKDPEKFATAYDQLTQGCNACHAATNHPFVVIKPPDATAFPNQEFGARR